ncbi:MAG: glycoside hydrolase family 2 protein [Solirubrobacteraceae bacterium]
MTERRELNAGWELARTDPDRLPGPTGLDGLDWAPARVPGTVAGALAGLSRTDEIDGSDWWFRLAFDAEPAAPGERVRLMLGGLATVSEVYLNGEQVLACESMFAGHELDVGARLRGANELAICFRALGPRLRARRSPRARWRTRLVSEGNLRFYRTMLLGRAPGFAPGPAVAGPWRPVTLERASGSALSAVRLRAAVAGDDGLLDCAARVVAAPGEPWPERVRVTVGGAGSPVAAELPVEPGTGAARGRITVPGPQRWWPHTHGRPVLYEVEVGAGEGQPHRARIGFRDLRQDGALEAQGLRLSVNGRPVFARGAVWTPLDLRAPHADEARLRPVLERVVAAGMNMLRVPGVATYESQSFYDLCDELGILVWQDFMFANLDYPEADEGFMATVEAEARAVLHQLGGRPSLAVLCGGSEVAQQVAMVGLDPGLAAGPLYGELLPRLVAEADIAAPYVPSTPFGGDLPFRPGRGVANYYGVGAYRRPLADARLAGVRFAAECLAFANVPDAAALEALDAPGGLAVGHPAWKAGVPRDAGAGWDFDDVRDHYFTDQLGLDPVGVRTVDFERYLDLSRAVSGEVMAEVLGEWRRAGSTCQGALVLWLKDLAPGAGWGILDHRGLPKVAYHHLRRALAPVAVWLTDEGLGGIDAHVANDGAEPLDARLRISLYREDRLVDEALAPASLGPGEELTRNVEAVVGRFVDASWAYRFGPPAQDLVVASLEGAGTGELLSQAFRFPAGRPLQPRAAEELGVSAAMEATAHGGFVRVGAERLLYAARLQLPGSVAADDAFCVEPGRERRIALAPATGVAGLAPGAPALTALNLRGRVAIAPAP